ncbi:hypothetical protein QQF64_012980 [Cirrhinus molitorella]|uniref:Immunoglobulin V-set domain-containing protein n=1 Tax=Cirrhinus molitorella TaxID=172907 RepID=A0ABR3LT36_9TELE
MPVTSSESVSLNCSMINRHEIVWYQLRSEKLDQLIVAEKDETGKKLLINYNRNSNRLKITADRLITTVSLVISGVTESDSGLYFCGTKSDTPELFFDKPIRLKIEDLSATEEPKKVDITGLDYWRADWLTLVVVLLLTVCSDHLAEMSVKTGKELKLAVLLTNADKVETNSSGEWREGLQPMTQDSEGEILITLTVTESSTQSREHR